MIIRHGRIDAEFPSLRCAIRDITLRINAQAAAILIGGHPAHHKAAIRQCEDGWLFLVTCHGRIDEEFPSLHCTVRGIALRINAQAAAILIGGHPAHYKAAIRQCGDGRLRLITRHGCIDAEFPSLRRAIRGIALRINAQTAAILIGGHPAHHKTAIRQRSDVWLFLVTCHGRIDAEFIASNGGNFNIPIRKSGNLYS